MWVGEKRSVMDDAKGHCTVADFFVGRQKIFTCWLVYGEFRQVCDSSGACRAISDSARSQKRLVGPCQLVCDGPRQFVRACAHLNQLGNVTRIMSVE